MKFTNNRAPCNRVGWAVGRRLAVALAAAWMLGACSKQQVEPASHSYWAMINVNSAGVQGDAHLVLDGGSGKAILIDTGAPQYAEHTLLPFLRSRGIRRLDAVFITHPHIDHYGGLRPLLLSEIGVQAVFMPEAPTEWVQAEPWGCSVEDLAEIRKLAEERSVPLRNYSQWREFRFSGDFVFEKLCSFDADELSAMGIGPDINELSLVAVLRHGQTRALFAGDLNRSLSLQLVARFGDMLKCDLLKVPHHGAEGLADDEFFQAVQPRDALVPAPAELWASERCSRARAVLEALCSRVWVSGVNGHVTVHFSDDGYAVIPETGAAEEPDIWPSRTMQ